MYSNGQVLGATAAAVTAVALPNTGSNMTVTLALATAVGLVVWGLLYKYAR